MQRSEIGENSTPGRKGRKVKEGQQECSGEESSLWDGQSGLTG